MNPATGFACVSRGEGDQCDWTGASPQFIRPPGAQLNRNNFVVRHENPARLRKKHDLHQLDSRVEVLLDTVKRISPASTAIRSRPETVPVTNFHVDDIATQLSRFTLNQAIPHPPVDRPQSNPNSQISVKEVEDYAEDEKRKAESAFTFNIGSGGPRATPSPTNHRVSSSAVTSPVIEGILGIGKGPATFEGIMGDLPKHVQIKACLEQFEYHRAWMHRILHRPTFWQQVYDQIRGDFAYTDQRAQLHWLAVLFSVCGLGLFNNIVQSEQALKDYELPISVKAQRDLALRWCKAATGCLEVGAFEAAPSIDSISAMAILAQLPLYTSNGETLGLALKFIEKAIHLAMKLDLHIDPDLHPTYRNSTALVKQNRRRLMVAVLCQHYKMSGLLCQDRGLFPLEQFAGLELPLDRFDEDFDIETGQLKPSRAPGPTHTIMTGVRCRFQVSRIWQEIGIMFSNPAEPPSHEKVMKINAKLKQLEAEWPEVIRTQFNPTTCTFTPPFTLQSTHSPGQQVLLIDRLGCFAVFAAAMVRLHRGFLTDIDGAPAEDIRIHREQVYYYARAMLAINRAKLFPIDNVPLQFFVLSSTISLAVYCLTSKSDDEFDKCEAIIKELGKVKNVLKQFADLSSILRRTYAVLNFALNKWEMIQRRTNPVDGRSHKRVRIELDNQVHDSTQNSVPNLITNYTNQVAISSDINQPGGGMTNHDDLLDDASWMNNLVRSLIPGHILPDLFELNHDKHPQNYEPMPTSLSNPTEVPHDFSFPSFFQPDSTQFITPTTSNASNASTIKSDGSSSLSYLSTPSSSTNLALSSGLTDQELNSSPVSLNYPSTFQFGSTFEHETAYKSLSADLIYPPISHHPVVCNANELGGLTNPHEHSLDGSFKTSQLVMPRADSSAYNIPNQFNLPVTN